MSTEMIYMVRASRRGGHAVHVEKIVGIYPDVTLARKAMRELAEVKPKHATCITYGLMRPTTKSSRLWMRSFIDQPKPLFL